MRKSEWKDGRAIRALFSILDDLPTTADRAHVAELLTDPPDQVQLKALIAALRCLDRAEDRELMLIAVQRRYAPIPYEPCGADIDDETCEDCPDCDGEKSVTVERR